VTDIKVTAFLLTYNHRRFIEQAVESALAQTVAGNREILIADDCSTDGTREVLRMYAERCPKLIRLLLMDENMGRNIVRARGVHMARGKYTALLDGDDYWTSPLKLQKQIDYLDHRPACAMCFHNTLVVYEDDSKESHPFHSANPTQRLARALPPETSTLEDVAAGNFMLSSSVMFRTGLIDDFPDWYFTATIDDWPLHVLNAEHGSIGYVDEVMSVYRVHAHGAWSDRISHYKDPKDLVDIISIYDAINRHLAFRYDGRIRRRTAYLAARAANVLADQGRFDEAAGHARRSLADAPNLKGFRGRVHLETLARPRLARARASRPGAPWRLLAASIRKAARLVR
jgi:glycosyltransferase involved in cell wall biosynthesis